MQSILSHQHQGKEIVNQQNECHQLEGELGDQNEDTKTFNDEFIDGNGNVWNRDDPTFLGNLPFTWKTEDDDVIVIEDDDVSETHPSRERGIYHNIEEEYVCSKCSFRTTNEGNLRLHTKYFHTHLPVKSGRCSCNATYTLGTTSHMEEINPARSCELCGYTTNCRSILTRHMSRVHGERIFKCHLCEYVGKTDRPLKRHIETVHLKMKSHKCHLCEHAFSSSSSLKYHIQSIHLKLTEFKCDLCDYETGRKPTLDYHKIKAHSKGEKLKCQFCDFTTHRKEFLKGHIDAVHLLLRNEKCHLCDFVTARKDNLKSHIRRVHLQTKQ